jgi:hypothetical protein
MFNVQRFKLKKLNDAEVKEQLLGQNLKQVCNFKNSVDTMDVDKTWQILKKISQCKLEAVLVIMR